MTMDISGWWKGLGKELEIDIEMLIQKNDNTSIEN